MEFRPILNFSRYGVSMCGKIKNLETGLFRKTQLSKKGYEVVTLVNNDGKKKTIQVHRAVAISYIPNPENKEQVNHKDGVKTNNYVDNLEWATNSENQKHAHKIGLKPSQTELQYVHRSNMGKKNRKLSDDNVREIRQAYANKEMTQLELAIKYGISDGRICTIVNRKSYKEVV